MADRRTNPPPCGADRNVAATPGGPPSLPADRIAEVLKGIGYNLRHINTELAHLLDEVRPPAARR